MNPIAEAIALLRPHSPRVVLSQWADAGLWHASILDGGKFIVDVKGKTLDEALANMVTAAKRENFKRVAESPLPVPPGAKVLTVSASIPAVEFEELF